MGCVLRIIGVVAVIVLALSIIMIFCKWLAPGFDFSWGTIWGMFGGSLGVFGLCVFIINRD